MNREEFNACFEVLPMAVDEAKLDTLRAFMDALLETNKHINLTRIVDEEEFVQKHLIDSLIAELPKGTKTVADIGTGGGFPGVPLAILYDDMAFTLIDSTAKKLNAVKAITDKLGLTNITYLPGRAEEIAQDPAYREGFDVVVSRAVADYPVLCELCLPFVKVGGSFYAWKGERVEEEISRSEKALDTLGGELIHVKQNLLLKSMSFHVIILCGKIKPTPAGYPRNFGRIKKKPLE